ncbi:hypothetical protein SISNIDRAFT_470108 [Sistotremastrum niveocremeum HHB9708]|uniref:Uncharacterized protein n=1 Tax=Sistotremastrum niveocremeum HHB9708 TaxID=1314777 RepID=A0A164P8Z2_9AGAM|nr:hypothetical protein SISNIDRAFT_470108 [Sistotremastrum niveocremeum HHB9708]
MDYLFNFVLSAAITFQIISSRHVHTTVFRTSVAAFGLVIDQLSLMNSSEAMADRQQTGSSADSSKNIDPYLAFATFFTVAYVAGSPPIPEFEAANSAIPDILYCFVLPEGPIKNGVTGAFGVFSSGYLFSIIMHGMILVLERIFSVYRVSIVIAVPLFILRDTESLVIEGLLGPMYLNYCWAEILEAAVFSSRQDVRSVWHLLLPSERATIEAKNLSEDVEAGVNVIVAGTALLTEQRAHPVLERC